MRNKFIHHITVWPQINRVQVCRQSLESRTYNQITESSLYRLQNLAMSSKYKMVGGVTWFDIYSPTLRFVAHLSLEIWEYIKEIRQPGWTNADILEELIASYRMVNDEC